ncbi:MAG: hypothetical protein A2268_03000 [Candidatus Raymondbacteria bacterium RifOxyA12_full_50_37]|uniref:PD-(D/E)XK endonuclease-like domain-containing protein n=1 Tax=Candidatus Raymondbacteria bacterium RIFOXYD12_FULL_49_13 TaxID=1817890 RepID=A0A1F7F9A6_UNCRA|nr:MAG: hypothetical protein A2248_17105 [Candidatus Raymondbacteria bacterium RIFOXYA2_FULL_49_16]OGJ90745.1 MAG: hypothetical protein A2268_03000 [Candidatus Raymondbacteria bacterium RifOxyA12_full_50_37]OGJ98382.1 MAG: hypothetical protein A2453_09010 [Candidatus Raymondbacteria bacterium RIFOXYC2_FULL_50_21]OGK03107.1 MAG: hypothetical protein A2519_06840 [Candidatus Raymondbacteria bacterium RIFOXYD12_FULL_49_13]OGK06608.1 MAG: hypothetical protein A2487_03040 [Candidatus Raymondbacteria 
MQVTELSFSSLSEYLQFCPLKYYFRKVLHLEPEFLSAEMIYGSGFHKAVEAYFRAKMENKTVSADELMVLFCKSFEDPKIRYNGQGKQEMADEAFVLLKLVMDLPIGRILAVEQPITIPIAKDFQIIGYIDLLTEENDGKRIITDWKTCKKRPNPDDVAQNMQLSTYNLAYPDAELRIAAVLKQKKPAVEFYPTSRTYDQRKRTVKTFIAVKQSIEAGQWYPREGWWCEGCQYQAQCTKEY